MEYKAVFIKISDRLERFELELNKYAKEGWEIVFIIPLSKPGLFQWMLQAGITSGYTLIFKKCK